MPTAKRKRVLTTKSSRQGCMTCRVRRIKCDEAKPACKKCTSTGRTCDGYALSALADIGANSCTQLQASNAAATSPLVLPPTSKLAWTMRATDLYAYDYFRRETAEPLQLIQPAGAWVRLALQMSLESDPVLRAMLAVGVAHRANINVTHTSLPALMLKDDKVLARKLYGEALVALQRHIQLAMQRKAALEPILVTCLLLIAFEIIFQDEYTAFSHYRLARRLVDHNRDPRIVEELRPQVQSKATAKQLSGTFDRLQDELAPLLDKMQIRSLPHHCIPPTEEQLTTELTTLINEEQAILHDLRTLTAPHWNHRTDLDPAVRLALTYCHSRAVALPPDSTIPARISAVLDRLHTWTDFVTHHVPHESRCSQLLKIRHFASLFSLSTCRATWEGLTECFAKSFDAMLDMIESYLSTGRTAALHATDEDAGTGSGIAMDRGIIPALHLIATKSRHPLTRRRAATLLRTHPRREGLRWSPVVAAVAESVISLEESRAGGLWPMPEAARFAEIVICGERADARSVRLVCARFEAEGGARGIVVEEFEGVGAPLEMKGVRTRSFELDEVAVES